MRAAVLFLLAAPAFAQQPLDLSGIVAKVERRTARRLVTLAREARDEGLPATARLLFEQSLEMDPKQMAARRELAVPPEKNPADQAKLALDYLARAAKLADSHLLDVIRVCVAYGKIEARRPILEPLLLHHPQREEIHRALRHEKVGALWVRPQLVAMVKAMPWRLQAWRNHAEEPVTVARHESGYTPPGVTDKLGFFDASDVAVVTTLEGNGVPIAVARTQKFLRFLLGQRSRPWSPSPAIFLGPEPYKKMVRALHEDDRAFQLYNRYANYEHGDFYAFRVFNLPNAAERYAHAAGYLTMYEMAAPPSKEHEGRKDTRVHAWLMEGFGYLLSLELFNGGDISFASIEESTKKRTFTRPPPPVRNRETCLKWLKEQIVAGRAYPLREVCGKSLNNLDFCASMQAWTFLRFLFLYDPEKAKQLPAALRDKTTDPQADRVNETLRELFGLGFEELEPLWRAYLLELS